MQLQKESVIFVDKSENRSSCEVFRSFILADGCENNTVCLFCTLFLRTVAKKKRYVYSVLFSYPIYNSGNPEKSVQISFFIIYNVLQNDHCMHAWNAISQNGARKPFLGTIRQKLDDKLCQRLSIDISMLYIIQQRY